MLEVAVPLESALQQSLESLLRFGPCQRGLKAVEGVEEPVGVSPAFSLDGLAGQVPAKCRAVADLDARPDVRAAKQSMNVAHRGVFDVSSQFIPTLAVRMNTQAFIISSGKGGPADSTMFLTLYLYDQGFTQFDMGYASAIAWLLLAIIAIFTALNFLMSKVWVFYGDND